MNVSALHALTARRLTSLVKSSLTVLPCLKTYNTSPFKVLSLSCDNNQPLSGSTAPQHAKTGSVPEVVVYNNPQLRYPTRCCKSFRDSSSTGLCSRSQSQRGTSIIITSSSHTRRLHIISTLFARNSPARIFTGLQEALLVCHFDDFGSFIIVVSCSFWRRPSRNQPNGSAILVGRASYPYEGNNPVFFLLLPFYSCIQPAFKCFEISFCAQISLSLSKHSIYLADPRDLS
ncbi:uncharacterized protein F5891DRAFT_41988 [Suillus fuscotomentosus]|uniref:Uncharacterized protein n=1 Tax=Suillus fuscotomentosus TaxID=1912939 RepID=A0AAD4EDX2_9AGAM|nr:uncharacterized protein F5891DRAFT_41988 [Suillus fuscotomentosus]KAG1904357.1 hypothetical protein F5891DRAFT_41988 [Suillus fuscotomentosus]